MIYMFSCTLIVLGLLLKWHLFTAPDKTMDKCMQLVFALTDPRINNNNDENASLISKEVRSSTSSEAKLQQEILSLHLEIGNAPKTCSTILGAIRLNFKTLISYVGGLVNFAVMIISIRMAIK